MPEVTLRVPRLNEMATRRDWMADPAVMEYNAGLAVHFLGYDPTTGCIDFPESQWKWWHTLYTSSSDRAYWFVEDSSGLVGHAHYHVEDRRAAIGLMVLPHRRGEGLGRPILLELIRRIEERPDVDLITNEFPPTRTAAERLHARVGFRRTSAHRLVLARASALTAAVD